MKFNLATDEIKSSLDYFHGLYNQRPIEDNVFGMKTPHLFATYCFMKHLNPKNIIESGVYKGQGSWILSKACSDASLYCIEPRPEVIQFKIDGAKYFTEDFSELDFGFLDKENTVVFFDDHQNALERIKLCSKLGFKHLIFEDNYPVGMGDCLSPKKILSKKDYYIRNDLHKFSEEDYNCLKEKIKIYYEFPPIFKDDVTKWGDAWNEENYSTVPSLLDVAESAKYPHFWNERRDYTWICYVELI